ncbi:MAG: hypothetical protein ACKV2T_35040 [Kofleriaceae bacterium]
MRVLAAVAFVLAVSSTAVAQPGMTSPTYGPTYGPPPAPSPAPQGQPYYGGGYGGYQPQYAQPPQPMLDLNLKSAGTALLWSVGTTLAGVVMISAAFEEESEGLLLLGTGLALVGPSAGHIYAGEGGRALKGSLLRAGGLLVFTLGAIESENQEYDCYDSYYCEDSSDSDGEAAMWIGGLLVVGSTLYDFYDSGRAAHRYNDRRRKAAYQFAPTMMSKAGGGFTPGVGVTGSF